MKDVLIHQTAVRIKQNSSLYRNLFCHELGEGGVMHNVACFNCAFLQNSVGRIHLTVVF